MRARILGLAVAIGAMAISTTPAAAGTPDERFAGSSGGGLRVGFGQSGFDGHHHNRHRGNDGGIWVNGGEWARYNNSAFQADSYNDWWHDRPDRAYPAWVRNNQNCARQWYAGTTLRC